MSITVRPGDEFTAIAIGLPQGLIGTLTFGVRILPAGTLVIPETTDEIVEHVQSDGTSNYEATRTMPADTAPGPNYETSWPAALVIEQEDILVAGDDVEHYYEIDELVFTTRPVPALDGAIVQAVLPADGASVRVKEAGTSVTRQVYDAPGGTPLAQPLIASDGRVEGYIQGENPVDLEVNGGPPDGYTQRYTPPQAGPVGPAGAQGPSGSLVAPKTPNGGDDFDLIQSLIDSVPAVAGGEGGARLELPARTPTGALRTYDIGNNMLTIPWGVTLACEGMLVPLHGSRAGTLVDVPSDYSGIEGILVKNFDATAASRAIDVRGSEFSFVRVYLSCLGVGGYPVRLYGAHSASFNHVATGGAGTNVCDAGIYVLDSNAISLRHVSMRDTKSALRAENVLGLSITDECHIESIAGGALLDGGIVLTNVLGFLIKGDYFEAINAPSIVGYSRSDISSGGEIGANTFQTGAGPAHIWLANITDTFVGPNDHIPAPSGPNANIDGVRDNDQRGSNNIILPQRLHSGTGMPVRRYPDSGPPRCRASRGNAATSAAYGGWFVIPLDTKEIDTEPATNPMWDPANSRIVIRTAGRYRLKGQVSWQSSATGVQRYARITTNSGAGVVERGLGRLMPVAGNTGQSDVVPVDGGEVDLAVGDIVELWGLQDAAVGQPLEVAGSTGQNRNWLSVTKVVT